MSHARASRLCWGLILISAQAARKAFINPLRHYNETSGQIGFILDIEGSESVQEVLDAVQACANRFCEIARNSHCDASTSSLRYLCHWISAISLFRRLHHHRGNSARSVNNARSAADGVPDSQYKGNSSNCTKLFVNSPPFDSGTTVHGINSGIHPRTTGSKADMLTIRAIYYEPRPVGLSPGLNNDLYTSAFNNMHERDLYIMRNILHANAVRLAPWDSEQDHSGFLRACKKYGMYVIPTFDLSYFLSTAARMSAFSQRQSEVWKGFQKFLHQALQDAADIEELILMWTVNFGLNLNETTEQGPRSISLLSDIRDEYFQLLRVIRSAQWLQECGPGKAACDGDRFKRPLGVPLLLDTILRQDNIGWYLGFSETVWGTWPVDELSLHIDEKTFNRLRPRGAFDAWIVQSQPPTNRQGQTDLAQQLKWFNATMAESHNAFAWHDLATQTLRNPAGDLLEGCDPGIGCTYPTQKLVIAQFGFAAEAPMYGSVNELVDPVLQQQLMGELYKGLSSLESCAEAGVTIDEWVDDWGRSEVLGCPGSVFQHPHTGPCDEVRPGRTIHHEWFGMNGQYTFLSFHCLDPRYHQEHPTRSSGEKVGGSAFRFDDIPDADSENQLWNLLPGGYCAVMHERLWLLALNFALFFCGAALEVFYWCKCCCFRKLVKPPRHRHPAHARAADSQVLLEAESPSRTDAIELGRFAEPPADMQDANNVVKAETPLLLPDEMSKGAAEVMICMTASVVREGKVQFTTDTLRFFAEAHVKTQCRRLKLQVEAEGHALDAEFTGPGRLSREECIGKAMTNIHARVLEGYFVWLEAQRDLRNKEQRLKAMLGIEPSRPRPAWMLFTEAAALRVVESLSEHALHSPEFISMMFHSMRWAESLSDDNAFLPDSVRFTVDYDALHYGVDAMRKNTNPFTGGVNFDDINDLGEARAEVDVNSVQKTFLESTSWRVLYDLLDNFGPVFTVKLWIFFLAFYVHLGSLPDQNDSFFSPRGSRSDAVQIMALLDASLLVLAELGLLWHGLAQRRLCRSPGRFSSQVKRTHRRWARRRLLSVMLGVGSLGAMVVVGKVGRNLCNLTPEESFQKEKDCSDEFAVLCCCAYAVIRLLVFFVFSRRRNIPFVHGTPADLKDKKANQPTVPDAQVDQEASSDSFLTVVADDAPDPVEKEGKGSAPLFVWLFVLALCFGFETFFVAPLVSGFSFKGFCGESCSNRLFAWAVHVPGVGAIHPLPSECAACGLTIIAIYALVGMTAFLDLHFLFYLVIGIGGYAMGEHRGLRNVVSSALRQLDLDASARRQEIHENELRDMISDGRAMEAVFGSAWRLVWSCAVESLYDDCLISEAMANSMVNAAHTFRWRDSTASKKQFAQMSQCFTKLRFRATQLRGGSWQQAGRSCCISELQVIHGARSRPKSYPVQKWAVKQVKVSTPAEHAELMEVLDDRLIATAEVPGLGVQSGWQLLSRGPSQVPNGVASGTSTPNRVSVSSRGSAQATPLRRNLTKAEDLVALRNASSFRFPADLEFTHPEEYREVVVEFNKPRCISAISFSTTSDDRQFDPVCWEIDGSMDGQVWMRLQTQQREFDTPAERREHVGTYFASEPWRKQGALASTQVDLQKVPSCVSERLCFFASSLRALLKQSIRPGFQIRPGRDTLLDSKAGAIPTLTQVVPVYEEQVILTEEFLCASDGRNTNLGFLIAQAEDQWEIFTRKHGMEPRELFNAFVLGDLNEWARRAEMNQDPDLLEEIRELHLQVRLWASQRSQTVYRTVAGAIEYHKVLDMLPAVQASDSPPKTLAGLVQLFIAHQTYGNKRYKESVDQDMRRLLLQYRHYPVYLVCDYNADLARPSLREMVTCYVAREHKFTGRVQFASLLLAFNENYVKGQSEENIVKVLEVLPRVYPLVLGELEPRPPAAKTQGKAGNQLGALRFAPGHYLQMMDANMGAFFGEACKVPFVLRHFQPPGCDRRTVQARIIGFREHIFTGSHGAVGAAMADAEWTFGTICQRFLAGLGARMHYGHPDFFDAFWASNRGSVSKASPILNLSEDIFAGFNVLMRGETSKHVDCLEWEKGREVSFNSASLFFTKVASGNVGVMRSRDLKILTGSLNIADSFSFYFASVGFYLYNVVTDLSMRIYVVIFVLLTLSSKSLDDVGKLDSLLAAEWVISFGTLAMFPRLMELTLEFGVMEGIIRFLPSVPGAVLVFTFMNKSIAEAVGSTMQTGLANYISTGRPMANDHYGWRDCYFFYRESHYYPALRILIMYAVYRFLAETFNVAALPMMILLATAVVWVVGPILFCPQPTLWSIRDDLSEFWCFIVGASNADRHMDTKVVNLEERLAASKADPRANLYDVWLFDKLKHKRAPVYARMMELAVALYFFVVMLAVVFGTMVDQIRSVVLLILVNYFILALWRVIGKPTILMMVSGVFWICSVPVVLNSQSLGGQYGTLLVAFILTFQGLTVIEKSLLLLAWAVLRPDPNCASLPEATSGERAQKKDAARKVELYDALVEYLYLNLMSYQWHLYVSIMLLAVNFVTQLCVAVLEMLGGLQSWWLLGGKLKGGCLRVRRPEYKPPGNDFDPPSERQRQLSACASSLASEGLRARPVNGDFLAHVEEYQETISKHRRRHSTGEFVCNEQLVDTQNIWSTMQMIVNAGFSLTRRYINVGAHDGHIDDPLYEYARSTNASGVAVERQPGLCARHREALPNVKVVCSEATPHGILDMIRPVLSDASEIDVMKVDIDSFDCPVLETLLPEVRARIILVEANPSIPPPYQWSMLYHPELWHFFANFSQPEEVPIRGCSLSYEVQLLRRFGYDLIAFGGHDAVFAHESVRSAFRAFTEVPMDEFDCYNKCLCSLTWLKKVSGVLVWDRLPRQWIESAKFDLRQLALGMRRLCCSYIVLLLHAGALRPQNDDRREATEADPDQDGEFVDPVDLDSPAALKKEDGSILGDLIYLFMPQSDGLDTLASAIVHDLPPLLEKEGLKCILAKDGSEGCLVRDSSLD
eukprot:s1357_g8.t1